MPILSTDILYRLSGGSGNTDQNASLGGIKSTTTVASSAIFDDVSSAESLAGDTEYRCVYVHNNHGSLTMQDTKIWIEANTPSATTDIAIALGGEGLNGTAETVANENTAPSGETFSSPANEGAALSMGNIPFGQHYPVWIRRTVNAGTAAAADSFTLRVKCDTVA